MTTDEGPRLEGKDLGCRGRTSAAGDGPRPWDGDRPVHALRRNRRTPLGVSPKRARNSRLKWERSENPAS